MNNFFSTTLSKINKSNKNLLIFPVLLATFCILLLSNCSGNYTFDSNVKLDNAEEYFSASHVKIYNNVNEFPGASELIGLVEGDDCQEKPHHAAPDAINARTKARQMAYSKKANGVIFTSCINIDTQQCIAQMVCYGKAYKIVEPNE